MALTTLDPKSALIVVDLQKGMLAIPTVHPMDEIVGRATALTSAFREHGLPVVLVNVTGAPSGRTEQSPGIGEFPAGWADLLPALHQQADDIVVTKQARSAFTNTGLTGQLQDLGVTQVVVVGVSTSGGVESTARHAHEYGFNVTFAVDAMTDRSPDSHEHSINHIFPRIGEIGTTDEIIDLLAGTR